MTVHRTLIVIEQEPAPPPGMYNRQPPPYFRVRIAGRAAPENAEEAIERIANKAAEAITAAGNACEMLTVGADGIVLHTPGAAAVLYVMLSESASEAAAMIPAFATTQAEQMILFALALPGRRIAIQLHQSMITGQPPYMIPTGSEATLIAGPNCEEIYLYDDRPGIGQDMLNPNRDQTLSDFYASRYPVTVAGLRALAAAIYQLVKEPARLLFATDLYNREPAGIDDLIARARRRFQTPKPDSHRRSHHDNAI